MLPTYLQRCALVLSFFCSSVAVAQQGQPGDGAHEQGKLLFGAMCAACHVHDRMHVGPSLVEIAGLYGDKRKDFRTWCKDPKPKRKGVIQMPSMASLTDDHLNSIHGYIVASTKGLKEVVVKNADKFRASPSMRRRPLIMRLFMPLAGPAAIAVAVNDDYHFCFDAGECRLRYVWKGDFVDGWPVWKGNGNGLAKIVGNVLMREAKSPLPVAKDAKRKVLGYRVKHGLPTFRYLIGKVKVEERISMSDDGQALARRFVLHGAPADWRMTFTASDTLDYFSDDGRFDGLVFTPNKGKGKVQAFTIIMEEKN
jgi:cytochrome c551/c552